MLIWQVLDGLLHHLFLMMIHDFPLAIRKKKKREFILVEIEGVLEFLELWSSFLEL